MNWLLLPAAIGAAALLAACPPLADPTSDTQGQYIVSASKLYDNDSKFDLRSEVVYPKDDKPFNPSLNISDEELTVNRCTRCHECGFEQAFDWEHYGTNAWSPRYKGEEWSAPLQRMVPMQDTLLNEEVAQRIYNFLRDVTLGTYDESQDARGAIVVETDQPPPAGAVPVPPS